MSRKIPIPEPWAAYLSPYTWGFGVRWGGRFFGINCNSAPGYLELSLRMKSAREPQHHRPLDVTADRIERAVRRVTATLDRWRQR